MTMTGSDEQNHEAMRDQGPAVGYELPRDALPRTDGTAVASLVFAILSFVAWPLLPALLALYLASRANQNIAASGGRLSGEQLTKAARIVAGVNLLLCVLLVAVIALGASATRGRSVPVRTDAPVVPQPAVTPTISGR